MENLELFENGGGMIWWKKCEDAARYIVHLYVKEITNWDLINGRNFNGINAESVFYEISRIEKDRHTCYHTFQDLHQVCYHHMCISGKYQMSYCIEVEAESHDGEIIASSGKRLFCSGFSF